MSWERFSLSEQELVSESLISLLGTSQECIGTGNGTGSEMGAFVLELIPFAVNLVFKQRRYKRGSHQQLLMMIWKRDQKIWNVDVILLFFTHTYSQCEYYLSWAFLIFFIVLLIKDRKNFDILSFAFCFFQQKIFNEFSKSGVEVSINDWIAFLKHRCFRFRQRRRPLDFISAGKRTCCVQNR